METNIKNTPIRKGIPTYFRALCWDVSKGGARGYEEAGYTFAGATADEQPLDAENSVWKERLGGLKSYMKARDYESIWQWYERTYPNMMALIPARRRSKFVDGVLRAYDEGTLWF
jgi:hypothetical protein